MYRHLRVSAVTTSVVSAAALALGLLFAACGDGEVETATESEDGTHEHANDTEHSGHGDHALLEVADGDPVPTVEIEAEPDPVSGVNVHVDVTNFDVAPENASTEAVNGEGHFHAYVDGEKVARFYNQSIHLSLPEGDHTVMVELSANDHSTYALDGEPIAAHAKVTVPASDGEHPHHEPVQAADPAPSVDLDVSPDPKSGWNVHAAVANLTIAPRSAGRDNVDGEGHLHLYVDGVKVTRLYGEWWHLDPLPAGEHEITVEVTANNHAPYVVDGEPVSASVTIEETEDRAAGAAAEADTVIEVSVIDGEVQRDETRFVVDEGSTVGLIVTSDESDLVHVHGYDILTAVGPDAPADVVFTADSSGVFEVELEGAGLFLFDLQIG